MKEDGKNTIGQNLNVTDNKRNKARNTSSDNAEEKTEVSQLHFSNASLRRLACSLHVFVNGTTITGEIVFSFTARSVHLLV